eukprot:scaffold271187_cov43-Tisochrysis_lutea.AAC.1
MASSRDCWCRFHQLEMSCFSVLTMSACIAHPATFCRFGLPPTIAPGSNPPPSRGMAAPSLAHPHRNGK